MKLREVINFTTKGYNISHDKADLNLMTDFYEPTIYGDNNAWYYITMKCVSDNYIERVFFTEENRDYSKYILRDGDIVLCKLGPYFRTAIYDNAFPFEDPQRFKSKVSILVSENIYILGVDKHKADPYYIAYILSLKESKEYFKSVARGEKTKVLNIEDALDLEIPSVTLELKKQTEIFKKKLLLMGKNYKAYNDEVKKTMTGKMVNKLKADAMDLESAIESGDVNKVREIVGKMGLHIRVPEKKKKEFEEMIKNQIKE